jgi:hypothetical protein
MRSLLIICALAGALLAASAALATAAEAADPDTFLTYHPGPTTPSLQWILRFQMGQGILRGDAGMAGAALDDHQESDHSNIVVTVSGLRALNWLSAAGLEGRVETNSLTLEPQSFNVSSWDLLLQYELGRTAVARGPGSLTPYLQLGAGWSFHGAEASAHWPFMEGGGPPGTAVSMKVTSSPALEGALGLDVQANRMIALNLQGGYRRDEPRYRIRFSGEPERAGTLHLSEVCIRGGVKFLLGRVGGGAR